MQGASTMRNAVKRVTHKERAQPKARARFGLLEKHKDYVERANDFKKKKAAIKTLKKKAAERNPDEFYFAMNTSKVVGGVHQSEASAKGRALDTATVRLLKTQDMGYLVHKKSVDDRKAEKLGQNLHFIGEVAPKKHTIFVDSSDKVKAFDAATHFDTVPELVGRTFNRPRASQIDGAIVSDGGAAAGSSSSSSAAAAAATSVDTVNRLKRKQSKAYKELQARKKRADKLQKVVTGLALQRNLMGKGAKQKIVVKGSARTDTDDDADDRTTRKRKRGDDDDGSSDKSTVVYKWKRERRR